MNFIVLISDFGSDSPYVAEMKGAIYSVNPMANIVDGTHAVPPQNVMHGAFVLQQLATAFPSGTIFVSVVDPGVGSNRSILLVEYKDRFFIAPDNGLLGALSLDSPRVRVLDKPAYWSAEISSTFHGRDIMGPVAAHLSNGVSVESVSSLFLNKPATLSVTMPDVTLSEVTGEIVFIDSFGNLISNIAQELAQDCGEVAFAGMDIPVVATYADATEGSPLALIGSSGFLEIAVVNGNAREFFAAEMGHKIRCPRQ